MLGIINTKSVNECLKLIGYLSVNECDKIYIKRFTLSEDELQSIIKLGIDYGVSIIFNDKLYTYKGSCDYKLDIKMFNSNCDKIIELHKQNVDRCIIFNGDLIVYYNKKILLENNLCLIVEE